MASVQAADGMSGPDVIGVVLFGMFLAWIGGSLVTAWLAAHEQALRDQMGRDAERRAQERREPMRRGELDAYVDALVERSEERMR